MDTPYWLGDDISDNYSRVSTCLALSQAVYMPDKQACVDELNHLRLSMSHGISEVLYSVNCKRQYLIALKERTKEIYVAFRGTESWQALWISFHVYAHPNAFQGTFHSGYYREAKLIPMAPFLSLLNKYREYKLIFTGHSLGGAIASIVTLNMLTNSQSIDFRERIHCVTFGSPFIADEACSTHVDQRFRENFHFYLNNKDVIPYLLTFVYNQASKSSRLVMRECRQWLEFLAAWLEHERSNEKRSSLLVRALLPLIIKQSNNEEFFDRSKSIFSTCRDAIKQLLALYRPFGLYFHTKCTSIQTEGKSIFRIEPLSLDEVVKDEVLLDVKNVTCSIQDHLIQNYSNEIYGNVIHKHQLVPPSTDCPMVSLLESFSNNSSSTPLSSFLPWEKDSWTWKDSSKKDENENHSYMWSIVTNTYEAENKEEISLRLYGPAVSLITGLKYENSAHAEEPLAPEKHYDESVRIFIIYRPRTRNRNARNYPFYIVSHFNTVNLTGLFDPKNFTLSNGMRGRQQQIADLSVLDLYKLAYASCTFTDDQMSTRADARRRKEIQDHLLFVEKALGKDCLYLEENYLTRLTKEQLKKLMTEISYMNIDVQNSQDSPPSSSDDCEDLPGDLELDPLRSPELSTLPDNADRTDFSTRTLNFFSISNAMKNWHESTLETSDTFDNVFSTTTSVVQVIPRLFTMSIALTKDFSFQPGVSVLWDGFGSITFIAIFTTAAACLGATHSFALASEQVVTSSYSLGYSLSPSDRLQLISFCTSLLLKLAGGGQVLNIVARVLMKYFTSRHLEYKEILGHIAKSLGVVMDQVRMHPYCLEEKISSIYCNRLKQFPREELSIAHWKDIFPAGVLNEFNKRDNQDYCLSIIECINANFQMRKLLSKGLAVGVVGPGKSGKSTIIKNMFGFNTNPDKEIRTGDLRSYPVNDDFRVVDFPHMTSVFDYVKNCFLCNHNLVNAIIVVLNAEQGGNDMEGEGYVVNEVKKLVKKGVNVLYCFNQCDKLALKKRPKRNRNNVDKFSLYESGDVNQTDSIAETNQEEYWTEEHAEKTRKQWAKNYNINPDQCWMTFCELEETDDKKCREIFHRLRSIQLRTHNDIKQIWLQNVFKENNLSPSSINEIMNFRYQEDE